MAAIIGLEMGTVYSTLGVRLDVVEMLDGLRQGAGRALPEGIEVTFAAAEEGGTAPAPLV